MTTSFRWGTAARTVLATSLMAGCGGDDPGSAPVPASITIAAGNAQSAYFGTAVAVAPAVLVRDAEGTPIGGVEVTFSVTAGGGSATGAIARTTTAGVATAGSWLLGPTAAINTLRASVGPLGVDFTAIPYGPGSLIRVVAGDGQSAGANMPAPTPPAVRVTTLGLPVVGAPVTFTVTEGGGTVTPDETPTDAQGVATLSSWVFGAPGLQALRVSVPGLTPVNIGASALSNAVATLAPISGDGVVGFAGNYTPTPPVVEARNTLGQPVAGATVTFTVTQGGGSASLASAITGNDGRAAVGAWRFGAAGPQSLAATSGGVVTPFAATATAVPLSRFDIDVRFVDPAPAPDVQARFLAARDRWQQVILGDVPDYAGGIPANVCGFGVPAAFQPGPVDDVVIFAVVDSIDGSGSVLAQAGPCLVRAEGQPIAGFVRFDRADLALLSTLGAGLSDVAFHEYAHILGFGTLWSGRGLLRFPRTDSAAFSGTAARQAWAALLSPGSSSAARPDVPVENCVGQSASCDSGTRDAHWREPVFGAEIMTGYYNRTVTNPFSAVSAAAMRDLGYDVNDAASDAYALPLVLGGFRAGGLAATPFREELAPWPIRVVDARGRVVGVVPR
jgi:hypothetical protein